MTFFHAAVRCLPVIAWLWLVAIPPAQAGEEDSEVAFQPPCGAPVSPAYAPPGSPPSIAIWNNRSDLGRALPADCIPWNIGQSNIVVAVAAEFRHDGSAAQLAAQFGAISTLPSVRYWSISDRQWAPLIRRAQALTGRKDSDSRPDFTLEELQSGSDLYFLQEENRTSAATYRLRMTSFSEDRITIELENVMPVRLLMIPIVGSGDFRSAWFLDRLGPGRWGYYSVVGSTSLGDFAANRKSVINRAVATFRRVAQIPTDQEPPAAP